MEQIGECQIRAPRLDVWEALHDPDVLAQCLDGCETMEKTNDRSYKATLRTKLGPLRVRLVASLEVVQSKPYDQYTLRISVTGGSTGFGSGTAQVRLEEMDGATTRLTYSAVGKVGGKFAQLGSRLLHSASKKMSNSFFANFANLWCNDPSNMPSQPIENAPRFSGEEYYSKRPNCEGDS